MPPPECQDFYVEKYKKIEETLTKIVKAYNFDYSNAMVDYFHVNFYDSVTLDWEIRKKMTEQILEVVA